MNLKAALIALIFCSLGRALSAEDFAQAWQEPANLTLPAPARSLVLASHIDAPQWLSQNLLDDARLLPQGRTTLVQFNMPEAQWQQQQAELCGQPGISECNVDACQSIQLNSSISNVSNAERVQARIVANPPTLDSIPAHNSEQSTCSVAAALPELDSPTDGAGINLNLDLQALAENTQDRSTQASRDPYAPDAQPAVRAADFALKLVPDFGGQALLQSTEIPADTTGYSVNVGDGCSSTQVPLSSLAPPSVPNLVVAVVTGDITSVAARHQLIALSQTTLTSTGDVLTVFLNPDPQRSVTQLLTILAQDNDIVSAQREMIYLTAATQSSYSDPWAGLTYGPAHTGALALHTETTGEGETIAVIDTGMAVDHPDLAGRVEYQDLTGKGWSADAHGTAVASIIAAAADNALGSYGVAPAASILALKACQPETPNGLRARCWTSSLVKALDVAMQKDAKIINMSLAGPPDDLLARYIALAVDQSRLIIAGAGNGGALAKPAFPAALPGVLAVTAVNNRNRLYEQANVGEYIDVAAPGVDIVTLAADGSFPISSGTSWAAAHVSGVAALLHPLMPLSSPAEIAFLLRGHSTDLGNTGKDASFGHGLIDVCAAAAAATANAFTCLSEEESSDGF